MADTLMCKVLEVSRSGFYAWRLERKVKVRRHHELLGEMKDSCGPRYAMVWQPANLSRAKGSWPQRVRQHGGSTDEGSWLCRQTRKKFKATTNSNHSHPLAENMLNRQFEQDSPDRVWLADITYIWTRKAGFIWRPSWTPIRERSSVGRWVIGCKHAL